MDNIFFEERYVRNVASNQKKKNIDTREFTFFGGFSVFFK